MKESGVRKRSVLIIDDEVDILNLLSLHLKLKDYEVLQAPTGKQGLDIAFSENPDLILLDVMLPDIDGFEVCKKIKENIGTAETPIIFLTARTQAEDKVKGLVTGADDYIVKPFDFDELELRIRRSLRDRDSSAVGFMKIFTGASLLYKLNLWLAGDKNFNLLLIKINYDPTFGYNLKELNQEFITSLIIILKDEKEENYFFGRIDDTTYMLPTIEINLEFFCKSLLNLTERNSKIKLGLRIYIYQNIKDKFNEATVLINKLKQLLTEKRK